MKVIFVLHSHRAGGAERHLLQLMQGLSASGVECLYAGPLDGWLGEQLVAAGFRCEHIPYHGFFDPVSLIRLVRLIQREKPDLIHGHLTRGAFYAGWASRFTSVPNVATAHSTNAGKHFSKANRIICVADAVNRYLGNCGYPKAILRTVHNGVPDIASTSCTSADVLRADLGLNEGPVIAIVARFVPDKGHDIALRALASIQDKPWTLVLAGALDTAYAAEMQQLAVQLGIASRVRFIGHSDHVENIYACADILLAPSRREAFSLTLLEAEAFSLPIIAADVGGISEAVINDETGLLVHPERHDELAHAISVLLDDAKLRKRMGMAGRLRYENHFSVDYMIHATKAVYGELVSDRSSR